MLTFAMLVDVIAPHATVLPQRPTRTRCRMEDLHAIVKQSTFASMPVVARC
jgi:hypothetical protein